MQTTSPKLLQRAASDDLPPNISKQTLIIIIVCAVVGTIILLVLLYRVIRSCRSRNVVPLPPVQPLVHEREQRLAKFKADTRAQTVYDSGYLVVPSPLSLQPGSPSLQGSQTSLLGRHVRETAGLSRQTSYTQTGEGSEEFSRSPSAGIGSKHLNPNSSSSPTISNDTSSCQHMYIPAKKARPPFPRTSKSLSQLNNDMQSSSNQLPHSQYHRSMSISSSTNAKTGSKRGLPHDPDSGICAVMPPPLSAGIETHNPHQSAHGVPSQRSMVDRWVPTGRANRAR